MLHLPATPRPLLDQPNLSSAPRCRRGGQQGAALVEFAIVLPVLLVLLLGIIDLGRIFYVHEALANAAREGARYCALHPSDPGGVSLRVKGELDAAVPVARTNPADPSTEIISCDIAGRTVTVTVGSDFTFVTPFMDDIAGGVQNGVADSPVRLRVSASMVLWQ